MQRRVARFTLLSVLLAGMVAASLILVVIERQSTSSVLDATQGLENVARTYLGTELRDLARARWITLGVLATFLIGGLFALAPLRQAQSIPETVSTFPPTTATPTDSVPEPLPPSEPRRHPDLASIARLCTDLSRVKTPDALPDLLGRSAAALDASGLILWVGVGDRLLPMMGHGYPALTMSSLRPVTQADDNAAATAWRTGEPVIVDSGHGLTGAIVVPLLGIDACLGVLAFEMPRDHERDPVTLALATLLAAQLSTVVPTSPAEGPPVASAEGSVESEQDSQAQSA